MVCAGNRDGQLTQEDYAVHGICVTFVVAPRKSVNLHEHINSRGAHSLLAACAGVLQANSCKALEEARPHKRGTADFSVAMYTRSTGIP